MSPGFAAEIELLSVLVRAEPEARDALSPAECDLIVEICLDMAAMGSELSTGLSADAARAARAGTDMLLAGAVPRVDPGLRRQLARAVEAIVTRREDD